MAKNYVDVFDIVPEDTPFHFETYLLDEIVHLNPALREAGYKVNLWQDGERDSFGPLTRIAKATGPDGRQVTLIYG